MQTHFCNRGMASAANRSRVLVAIVSVTGVILDGDAQNAPGEIIMRHTWHSCISTSKKVCLNLPTDGRDRVTDMGWIQKNGSNYNITT